MANSMLNVINALADFRSAKKWQKSAQTFVRFTQIHTHTHIQTHSHNRNLTEWNSYHAIKQWGVSVK